MSRPRKVSSRRRRGADARVVGYFGLGPTGCVCDGDACLIAGRRDEMLRWLPPDVRRSVVVSATTAGEVLAGLQLGAAYGLDPLAARRLSAAAVDLGVDVPPLVDWYRTDRSRMLRLQWPASDERTPSPGPWWRRFLDG